jgi:hypothetical protein
MRLLNKRLNPLGLFDLFRLQLPLSMRSAQIETLRTQLLTIGARIRGVSPKGCGSQNCHGSCGKTLENREQEVNTEEKLPLSCFIAIS